MKLHYFTKNPEYKYGRLREVDQTVIRRIISHTLDKDSLKAVFIRLSQDNVTRYPTLFALDGGRNEQGLQPPVYFLEWTQNTEIYKQYLKALQKSYAVAIFYEWFDQQANPPQAYDLEDETQQVAGLGVDRASVPRSIVSCYNYLSDDVDEITSQTKTPKTPLPLAQAVQHLDQIVKAEHEMAAQAAQAAQAERPQYIAPIVNMQVTGLDKFKGFQPTSELFVQLYNDAGTADNQRVMSNDMNSY